MRRFILGWKALGYARRFGAEIVNYADDVRFVEQGLETDLIGIPQSEVHIDAPVGLVAGVLVHIRDGGSAKVLSDRPPYPRHTALSLDTSAGSTQPLPGPGSNRTPASSWGRHSDRVR